MGALVPAGRSLSPADQERIKRAIRNAETSSGLTFSVMVGSSEEDPRRYAERLHGGLDDPDRSVLVLCAPAARVLEIVTGTEARRTLDDVECALAAASMQSSFSGGDIIGGLVTGIQQMGEAARVPRTLHRTH